MSSPYIIAASGDSVQPRLEINDLQKNTYQFSLFVRALNEIMKPGYQPDPASWKQIGGIHGVPYERWSGDPVSSDTPDEKAEWGGYCYHASVLFPTWHRVVCLLVEQAVYNEAHKYLKEAIAAGEITGEEQDKWQTAAAELRFPFWDWTSPATGKYGLPAILHESEVTILGPRNKEEKVQNPLYSYKFDEIPEGAADQNADHKYFGSWTRTYRWPSDDRHNPTEDYDGLNRTLEKGGPDPDPVDHGQLVGFEVLRTKVANLFSFPLKAKDPKYNSAYWDYFSNTNPSAPAPASTGSAGLSSLEEPHNKIHVDVGGRGHMSDNDVAGFDPLFFLHHANVDRLYALFEYVYPQYWIKDGYVNDTGKLVDFETSVGTFTEDAGAGIDHATPLTPFRKAESKYWISDDVRGLQSGQGLTKNYTYPPIVVKGHSIEVDKPCTDAERATYRGLLQLYFGGNVRDKVVDSRAPLFRSPIGKEIPHGRAHLPGYRHFIISGDLLQYAFPGSHRLELYLDQRFISDITVLSRGNPAAIDKGGGGESDADGAGNGRRAGGAHDTERLNVLVSDAAGSPPHGQRTGVDVDRLARNVHTGRVTRHTGDRQHALAWTVRSGLAGSTKLLAYVNACVGVT
ncbi:hypothetical protein PLICRDRAFT_180805 [Plicaturopsis crispa FD-325 SS-3]|uniref:tyrosinase n=1 Tax=Plicaturopsis crispa FD-325 SS-3 TaxID=944288 RepID=A0A0C9T1I0_PLICR|nr:hypothetical protein PLICRDRAFT_180805 [Plicaturopsis crispa FD-325 SS-3]